MQKITFKIIFFTMVLHLMAIEGIVEKDLFEKLWNNLNAPTSSSIKYSKHGGQSFIKKEEIDVKKLNYGEQNTNNTIKTEYFQDEKEKVVIKSQILRTIKREQFVDQNNGNGRNARFLKNEDGQFPNEAVDKKINEHHLNNPCNSSSDDGSDNFDTRQIQKPTFEKNNDQIKKELIKKFMQIRSERTYGNKYDKRTSSKIERNIARSLGITYHKIHEWRKELGIKGIAKKYSSKQKHEIIEQFEKVREEFSKRFNLKTTREINLKIVTKIGVDESTIRRWKREFGIMKQKKKTYTDAEKILLVKKFDKIKNANANLSPNKIAKNMGIDRANLRRWRAKFGMK